MNWQVRHQGSPHPVEMTLEELQEALLDGHWEPTDEVMGPGDTDWVAIENHPVLSEIAADMEEPPPRTYDDETRLDMNALIDVCLVLLVFFMLTTTVAAMQKRLEAPTIEEGNVKVAVLKKEDVEKNMIHVTARMEGGEPVIKVEGEVTSLDQLIPKMRRFVNVTRKTRLLLEHDDQVTQEVVVKIIDAAKGAGMDRVHFVVN